ncbi:hypothetical protein D6D54_01415 [Spiroplasma poulsonii]|uniref:Uncharacterized protein n=1 Tax=Spiroplasma poulsonii TaxID=2138 RepID=A0A433ETD8_9MOLU|nr:hypothetical protein D6D54_01415 [Spiroplasma poulsonii]
MVKQQLVFSFDQTNYIINLGSSFVLVNTSGAVKTLNVPFSGVWDFMAINSNLMLYVEITNIGFSSGNMYKIDAQGNYKFIGSNVVTFSKVTNNSYIYSAIFSDGKTYKTYFVDKEAGKVTSFNGMADNLVMINDNWGISHDNFKKISIFKPSTGFTSLGFSSSTYDKFNDSKGNIAINGKGSFIDEDGNLTATADTGEERYWNGNVAFGMSGDTCWFLADNGTIRIIPNMLTNNYAMVNDNIIIIGAQSMDISYILNARGYLTPVPLKALAMDRFTPTSAFLIDERTSKNYILTLK